MRQAETFKCEATQFQALGQAQPPGQCKKLAARELCWANGCKGDVDQVAQGRQLACRRERPRQGCSALQRPPPCPFFRCAARYAAFLGLELRLQPKGGRRQEASGYHEGKAPAVSSPSEPSLQILGRDLEGSPAVPTSWHPEALFLHLTSSLVHRDQNALRCLEVFGAGVYILCNQAPASFVSAMAGTGCLSDICCKEGFVRIVHLHCWASCRCPAASTSQFEPKDRRESRSGPWPHGVGTSRRSKQQRLTNGIILTAHGIMMDVTNTGQADTV